MQLVSDKKQMLIKYVTLKNRDSLLWWNDWSQSESYNKTKKQTNAYILLKLLHTVKMIENKCTIKFLNPTWVIIVC